MFTIIFSHAKDILVTQHRGIKLSNCIITLPEYDESNLENVKFDSE